jgi:exopolyphosphatase / guanosine-5'-triphosphate,3'-diphosphate pyrophosphatase
MPPPRCACIDIGSNTTRLLVGEAEDGRLREVLAERAFTRLGAERERDGSVPEEKVSLVAATVAAQARLARACGAQSIRIVATAAIRSARNRDELLAAVERASGVPVALLSGEEEARLAFAGATRTLRQPPIGEVGVVDVGGGSTELVAGTLRDGVTWSVSFRVGSGFLTDHYLRCDPPSAAELHAVREHVAGVFEGLDAPRPRVGYAVGGSATSLRRLVGAELQPDALERALRVLASMPIADVARRFALHAERVRLLPAGLLLLEQASLALGVPLRIAGGGLREGVVLEELARVPR